MSTDKCNVQINHIKRELRSHGSLDFPVGLYYDHLPFDDVPWHWHEQLEIGYVCSGKTNLSVNSDRIPIQQGEAFFINKEILHSCTCDKNDKCTIHSIVFKPELIGPPESVFAKNYINPVIENGKVPFLIFRDDENGRGTSLKGRKRYGRMRKKKNADLNLRSGMTCLRLF